MRRALTALVFSLAGIGSTWAQVWGPASVLGSDRVMVNGTVFQFNGLDGVEFHQFCLVDGQPWACGASATRALQTLLDGVVVTCAPTGEKSGDAELAVCTNGEQDIGETMVQAGWAVAVPSQSDAYVAAEQAARENGEGIWRGLVLEPSTFREDIAAIEERYSELVSASILAEAEQALAGDTSVDVFDGVDIRTLEAAEDVVSSDDAVRIDRLEAGFIPDAIASREVFSWPAVSRVLEDRRQRAVELVVDGARRPIWEGLRDRPHEVETVNSESAYHRAMLRYAEPLIDQGRQPVLLVKSPMLPVWVGHWFADLAPEGAVITQKPDAPQGYMGTIDGVDVYVGSTPGNDFLLLPDDLLISAGYRKNADGAILAIDPNATGAEDAFVFKYSIALEWKPDLVVWLHYPYEDDE